MALGARQQITKAGATPSYAAPLASQTITAKGGGTFLHVKNGNGSPCVVTFTDPGVTPAGSSATNPAVSVAASTGDKMIYVPPGLAPAATGLVTVAFSVQSSVSVAVLRMGS